MREWAKEFSNEEFNSIHSIIIRNNVSIMTVLQGSQIDQRGSVAYKRNDGSADENLHQHVVKLLEHELPERRALLGRVLCSGVRIKELARRTHR